MKKLFILLVGGVLAGAAEAQEKDTLVYNRYGQPAVHENVRVGSYLHKVSAELLAFGYTYERAISAHETLLGSVKLRTGLAYSSNGWGNGKNWLVSVQPAFEAGYRNYYNIGRRAVAGLSTVNNSANYFGAAISLVPYAARIYSNTNVKGRGVNAGANVFWGFQRNLGGNFSYDMNMGVGGEYLPAFNHWNITPVVNIGFHYNIK